MKVYVESIFLLDFKTNLKLNLEEEDTILNYDFDNNFLDLFNIEKIKLEKEIYILNKKRSYGYEIYIIYPDYLQNIEFDGVEIIEKCYKKLLSGELKEIFNEKFENYKGEYLFHQHIFNYEGKFEIKNFLTNIKFKLKKVNWSEYIYEVNKEGFLAIELLSIDNFILQRHIMYEHFSREYLERISNDINLCNKLWLIPFFNQIRKNINFLNSSRFLISQHKLLMENFKIKVISYIEENKLFYIHRIIRKKDIFEKIKDDFDKYISTSQQNLTNLLMAILAVIGIVVSLK